MNTINSYIVEYMYYIELIPVLAGIICYVKLEKVYKLFVWVLFLSFCLELIKIPYGEHFGHNLILTNLYNVGYFTFLFWVFHRTSKSNLFKKILKFIVLGYFLGIVYELVILKIDYHTQNQVIPYIIGGFGVIFCVFNYLYRVIESKVIINIYQDLLFWFVVAHFVYFLAFTPFKINEQFFLSNKEFIKVFQVKPMATLLKMILLSIGFLWTTRETSSS